MHIQFFYNGFQNSCKYKILQSIFVFYVHNLDVFWMSLAKAGQIVYKRHAYMYVYNYLIRTAQNCTLYLIKSRKIKTSTCTT